MATADELRTLASSYQVGSTSTTLADVKSLARDYIGKRKISILDAAAIAFAFDALMSEDVFDVSKLTPEMTHAWELAYPHVPIESLANRSTEELAGAISGWKGKLFEVEVTERLNNGEWVGDLHLEDGQHALIAESPTQPGWDIQIIDDDGAIADQIQLKATESVSYVHEALERYPDTPILATHEVAARMDHLDSVMDSGIHEQALTDSVHEHLADASSDAFGDGLIGAMPLSIIAATEAARVLAGKKTVDQALASGGDRIAKGVVSGAVATAVSVVATPLVGTIAGFITRLALNENDQPPRLSEPEHDIPRHAYLLESASRFQNLIVGVAPHYCTSIEPKVTRRESRPSISDDDELISLVDQETRLDILRSKMPLKNWLKEMICKSVLSMTQNEVAQHLDDLKMIKCRRLLEDAEPANGFLEVLGRAMYSDYSDLRHGLENAITRGRIHIKSLSGSITAEEQEELTALEANPLEGPFDRGRRHGQKRAQERLQKILSER